MDTTSDSAPRGLTSLGRVGDVRLARLASRGHEAAFAAIFRRYHQPLYRYCRAITGNGEDASDALQNTMVRVMSALPGERREIELKPWLFRIAHNESISLLRRRRPDAVLKEDAGGIAEGPEAGLASREDLRELMADLRELPERQRAAVILRELNGLSYAEIAGVFTTSTAAAKQAAYDGRVALHDFARGRAMDCESVTRAISDREARFLRGRKLRGHLRACSDCAAFKQAIDARSGRLSAIAPALPATGVAALMEQLFAGGGSAGGGSVGVSAGLGKLVAGAGAIKGTSATVAVMAVATGAVAGGVQLARPDTAAQPVTGSGGEVAVPGPGADRGEAARRALTALRGEPGLREPVPRDAARRGALEGRGGGPEPAILPRDAAGPSGPASGEALDRTGGPVQRAPGSGAAPRRGPSDGAAPGRPKEVGGGRAPAAGEVPGGRPPAAPTQPRSAPVTAPRSAPTTPSTPALPDSPEPSAPQTVVPQPALPRAILPGRPHRLTFGRRGRCRHELTPTGLHSKAARLHQEAKR